MESSRQQSAWSRCLAALGLENQSLIAVSPHDDFRRAYAIKDRVYKIVITDYESSSSLRANDPSAEFAILRQCDGLVGVPRALEHVVGDGYEALVLERLPGIVLRNYQVSWIEFTRIICKSCQIAYRISKRKVSHNDIRPRNILVTSELEVSLIDFDQGTRHGFVVSIIRSILGVTIGGSAVHSSVVGLVLRQTKNHVKSILPPKAVWFLKKHLNPRKHVAVELPELDEKADNTAKSLLEAWRIAQSANASAPGAMLAYYSFDYNGIHYPGERPWVDRFQVLKTAADCSEKKVLELGCNMGLLSCFLLKYEKAKAAFSVDCDSRVLQAAEFVAESFGVGPTYKQVDFDSPSNWEGELAQFKPDIVFALNVLNWVKDKQRLLRFLGQFDEVIFEGHDSIRTESNRLREVGFRDIAVLSVTERGRGLLRCRK